jgi:hypothetical protein
MQAEEEAKLASAQIEEQVEMRLKVSSGILVHMPRNRLPNNSEFIIVPVQAEQALLATKEVRLSYLSLHVLKCASTHI